jgi:hypothetical protein
MRAARAGSRLRAGQVAEAVAEVAELTKTGVADSLVSSIGRGRNAYSFACFYSIASSKVPDKQREYADRAMELLHQAVQAGYNSAVHMKQDSDLDSLREREDFQKLVAELEIGLQPDK